MRLRILQLTLLVAVLSAALATSLTIPASAEERGVVVQMPDGSVQQLMVDVPEGASLQDITSLVPGVPLRWAESASDTPPAEAPAPPAEPAPALQQPQPPAAPVAPAPPVQPPAPQRTQANLGTGQQGPATERRPKRPKSPSSRGRGKNTHPRHKVKTKRNKRLKAPPAPLRNSDGSPTTSNPGFVDALPGPSFATGVPNFVIRKFRVPIFLLPIYQAAGIQYGVRWEVLAALNEIETDYGRNLNVSSAGALGWMQFMPSTWKMYGVDANKDGKKDPYNPVDAIFAAARYLKAAGYEKDVRRSIFAYNHADWYVDSVMLRARLISGVPADLVGSLTGLTEGRFPVAARARYADDLQEKHATRKVKAGHNAANIVGDQAGRRAIAIYTRKGAPVVATNDGVIKKIGESGKLGRYLILQDVYGNRYLYSGLGSTARYYPVPKQDGTDPRTAARALKANGHSDPHPSAPASAGHQPLVSLPTLSTDVREPAPEPVKDRLFAHPDLPGARDHGGYEQQMDAGSGAGGLETYDGRFARPVKLDPKRFRLRRMRAGARVIGGTILGRVGVPVKGKAAHLNFGIRPAGKGAPRIDPKPILDGWKLLEATAIYRASGRNALRDESGYSIGQILLLPKSLLERRVLADSRVEIYPCGREDIKSGQIDRRVLATMEYLAESGMRPTITSLKCGHGFLTASGNVSEHSSGNAVDVAKINGIPIAGHQERGGVTEQAVRRLMALQGTMTPDQIISLLDLGANTMALADHDDHIHVGFTPRFGANRKLSREAQAVLRPGQWPQLLKRLSEIANPVVPTRPSRYAIPAKPLRKLPALR